MINRTKLVWSINRIIKAIKWSKLLDKPNTIITYGRLHLRRTILWIGSKTPATTDQCLMFLVLLATRWLSKISTTLSTVCETISIDARSYHVPPSQVLLRTLASICTLAADALYIRCFLSRFRHETIHLLGGSKSAFISEETSLHLRPLTEVVDDQWHYIAWRKSAIIYLLTKEADSVRERDMYRLELQTMKSNSS